MDRWLVFVVSIVGIGTMAACMCLLVAFFAWRNNMRRRLFDFVDASPDGSRHGG